MVNVFRGGDPHGVNRLVIWNVGGNWGDENDKLAEVKNFSYSHRLEGMAYTIDVSTYLPVN